MIDRPGNLYLVGMGMVSQVALGLATALPSCRVFALDTDGSMLLAPSILPVIGTRQPKNLYIVVFDNEQLFGSRGGPKSQTATGTNIAGIAKASGIESVRTLRDKTLLRAEVEAFLASEGPSMLVAKIQALGRGAGPKMDGQETNTNSSGMSSASRRLKFSAHPKHKSDALQSAVTFGGEIG